jgi:dihydropyrimidinase/dihydroorotase
VESEEQVAEIPSYAARYGVTSFKFYGQWRRVELDRWGMAAANGIVRGWDDGTFFLALEAVAEIAPDGILAFHPENWEIARVLEERLRRAGRQDTAAWDDRSPDFLEADHIRRFAWLAGIVGARVYAQHCTNARSVDEARRAKDAGVDLFVQTGPPWLYFSRDDWKIMPPLRARSNAEALWEGLRDGTIDVVGSDHVVARSTRMTLGDQSVWSTHGSAFASRVEMLLPIMLHEGVNQGRITLDRMVQVLCENPARILGLYPRKGSIEVGADADLTVLDLNREVEVRDEQVWSRPGWTLLDGHVLKGWPVKTIIRGKVVAEWPSGTPRARIVNAGTGLYLPRGSRYSADAQTSVILGEGTR